MERTKRLLLTFPSSRLQEAVRFGAKNSILGSSNTPAEFSTPQCLLLGLFHSLLTRDLLLTRILQELVPKVDQLKSSVLISWLRDDFNFNSIDVLAVLSLAARMIESQELIIPDYVLAVFTGLSTKYNIMEQCKLSRDTPTINLLSTLKVSVTRSQQTEPMTEMKPSPYEAIRILSRNFWAENDNKTCKCKRDHSEGLFRTRISDIVKQATLQYQKGMDDQRNTSLTLHEAAKKGDFEGLKSLIKQGASLDALDSNGSSAVHMAASLGNAEVVRFLIYRGVKVNLQDNKGWTPLHEAANGLHFSAVRELLDGGAVKTLCDTKGSTPLDLARKKNSVAMTKILGSKDSTDEVHKTVQEQGEYIHKAAKNWDFDRLNELINNGCDVNAQDSRGLTPLHIVAAYGAHEEVRHLLNHGAELDLQDHREWTALDHAIAGGNFDTMRILLERGAHANQVDVMSVV